MAKNLIIFVAIILIAGIGLYYLKTRISIQKTLPAETQQSASVIPTEISSPEIPSETVIAKGLDTPWAIVFLSDGNMLVTERPGRVRLVDTQGNLKPEPIAIINQVKEIGEGGLLGVALHPDFSSNNYVYLYYTYSSKKDNSLNKVVRMIYKSNTLTDEQTIVDNIPGNSNHNGGRIKFGPDGFLYITTGDSEQPSLAQNKNSLAGKILRVTDEGKPAPGNPFNTLVYSYGHRNPQGIVWDANGTLWETEHGPSGGSLGTGNDEVNLIESGKNYGWPVIQGDQTKEGMVTPVRNSTPKVAWAPGDIAVVGNSLFFSGLKGQALYKTQISNNKITDFTELFKGKYGRIREIILGPDNMLYISTSNRDGRGNPAQDDDKIIRINPTEL